MEVREYRVGDWVWRWYPTEKAKSGNPWTGPYEVKAVKEYSVSLELPTRGAGNRLEQKWIHVENLKPCRNLECAGEFCVLMD